MRDWFDALQPREQVMVLTAGVFVVFAVLYFGLWLPLDRGHDSMRSSVATWQRAVAEIGPLKAAVRSAGTGTTAVAGADQSLVVIVDRTLRQRGLYGALQRSQPTGNNGIRVEFENVAFDDLVLWLGETNDAYALKVASGSFSVPTRDAPGRVNAQLTLER